MVSNENIKQSGGGLALGCMKELKPCFVRDGGEEAETMSVNIFVQHMKIRCCLAYGPQESDNISKKKLFWKYLNEDVLFAKKEGAGFIL